MEIEGRSALVGRIGIPRTDAGDQRPIPPDNGLQPVCGQPDKYLRPKEDRTPVQRRKDILKNGRLFFVIGHSSSPRTNDPRQMTNDR
jgi:hypothetical protein